MKKPPVFPGIHPTGPCLDRLFHQEHVAIPRLMAFKPAAFVDAETGRTVPVPDMEGLIAAAIADNPRSIADRKRDVAYSAAWELQRYGCILLAENPYSQVQTVCPLSLAVAA